VDVPVGAPGALFAALAEALRAALDGPSVRPDAPAAAGAPDAGDPTCAPPAGARPPSPPARAPRRAAAAAPGIVAFGTGAAPARGKAGAPKDSRAAGAAARAAAATPAMLPPAPPTPPPLPESGWELLAALQAAAAQVTARMRGRLLECT